LRRGAASYLVFLARLAVSVALGDDKSGGFLLSLRDRRDGYKAETKCNELA
jgi:hypothetical protein